MSEAVKRVVRVLAFLAVVPQLISFAVRARIVGRDRALEGSTQALGLVPGLVGQYLRRAFLAHTIASCHETAAISFGTLFSQTGARIDAHVYVGAHCFLGLVHIERDVLIGSAVHVTSGRHTHGTGETSTPIREQEGERTLVRIGEGAWIGSAAVVMADVGRHSVVGAGSVVTKPIPDGVVAAGVPARVIRQRSAVELSAARLVE
jgi:acetyltransferase-like isoleucine patch superfamily enzyme